MLILNLCCIHLLFQGIPSGGQAPGPGAGPPASVPAPAAVPTGDVAAPAHTGSSPSAWDGEWCARIHLKECLFLSSLSDPRNPPATSQPPELLEKPAPVPSDETADPAERRPASRTAAGDRQGKPGAPAGEILLLNFFTLSTQRVESCSKAQRSVGPQMSLCHCRRSEPTRRISFRCSTNPIRRRCLEAGVWALEGQRATRATPVPWDTSRSRRRRKKPSRGWGQNDYDLRQSSKQHVWRVLLASLVELTWDFHCS